MLYFGDFDPSGEGMVISLKERLCTLCSQPEIIKCALTRDDIQHYNLPPAEAKTTDTRSKAFIAEHGNICVELDALPPLVLRDRLLTEVKKRMNLDELQLVHEHEKVERAKLEELLQ